MSIQNTIGFGSGSKLLFIKEAHIHFTYMIATTMNL
jgi:hypothetical protein